MMYSNQKISLRQALLLYIVMVASFSVRILPTFTSEYAKQAAWLCPLITLCIIILYLFVLNGFYKCAKYSESSIVDIIQDILGKILGKIICILYFVWITLINAYYLRFFAERLVTATFPYVNILFFIAALLCVITYVLRSGIVTLARMNEIFFWIIIAIYLLFNIFLIPNLKVSNWYPITHEDFFPVLKGSLMTTSLWCYITIIFFFGDIINNKQNIKKIGLQSMLLLTFLTLQVILIPLGIFGGSVLSKMPLPYFAAVRGISLFKIIERLDAGIIIVWTLTDFVLIGTLSFTALHILKQVFKASDTKPFVSIYMIINFFLCLLIANNVFELQEAGTLSFIPINPVLFLVLPFIIFIIGKIRRKI